MDQDRIDQIGATLCASAKTMTSTADLVKELME